MAQKRSWGFRLLVVAVLLLGLGGGFAAVAGYVLFLRDLPDFESLAEYQPALTTTVLDRRGTPIGEFYEERRQITALSEVPELVIQAFLAAEDDTFYEHEGVDFVSLLRAAWVTFTSDDVQGASTITQQMVKQLLLSPEQTYTRKIREMVLARRIEQRFSKEEILFLYLNQIYFGSGAYGIGEAARTYYGKAIGDVTVGEAAMLAGLPKAPGRHSPFLNPERAEQRRSYVLDRMLEEQFITAAQHAEARENPPTLHDEPNETFEAASYFTEEVRRRIVDKLGNELMLQGGLTIETTLDAEVQREARRSVVEGLEALDRRRGYRGPLRKVAEAERGAVLESIGQANGLVDADGPVVDSLADAESGTPLKALVTHVDTEAGRARLAFAPGLEAVLPIEEVHWAHPVDPTRLFRDIDDMNIIVAVGDVVSATLLPPGEAAAEEGEEPTEEIDTERRATLHQKPTAQGALLSFDAATGDILALVGGYDYEDSEFDRTTQALRQPGSAFKPIIYAAALTRGYTPASIIYDRPVVYEDDATGFIWRPENYGRRFLGKLTITEALARSVNNATIHLLQEVGIDYVMDFTRRLGIRSPLERNLGLALGQNPVTLLEITRAYGVFATAGRYVEPRMIVRVTDREGNVLLENEPLDALASESVSIDVAAMPEDSDDLEPEPEPTIELSIPSLTGVPLDGNAEPLPEGYVVDPTQAYLASSVLRAVVEHPRGTGRRAKTLGRPVAGKTGTTNDQADAWFVGFSPEIVTGVWVGFDEKQVLGRGETGGRAAAPIWIDFMGAAHEGRAPKDFEVPNGIVFARIDTRTGLLASPSSEATLFQAFAEGTEPVERATAGGDDGGRSRRLRLDL